jgi:hypothetical protein
LMRWATSAGPSYATSESKFVAGPDPGTHPSFRPLPSGIGRNSAIITCS